MLKYLQRLGKAVVIPISSLPIAGILIGISTSLQGIDGIKDIKLIYDLLIIMSNIGFVIYNNLPIIFAIGVAVSLAKEEKGVAAIGSIIGFFVMNQVISTFLNLGCTHLGILTKDMILDGEANQYINYVTEDMGIFTLNTSIFGGVITGIITSVLHNKYHNIELSQILGFFSGYRFVPIITAITMAIVGGIMAFIWPYCLDGLTCIAKLINKSSYVGTFIFGFTERALIPTGLHHLFYTPFWYGSFVQGDINGVGQTIYGANTSYFLSLINNDYSSIGEYTKYMAGKYPIMMFGLPGAALAMYKTAKQEKKKKVGKILLIAALTSFFTGITEPLEFTFLFVAPILFGIHCVLTGISFVIMDVLKVKIGMTFSGGLLDYIIFGILPECSGLKTNWILVILTGAVYFIVYYLLFKTLILKFNLKTPGRRDEEEVKLFSKEDYEGRGKKDLVKVNKDIEKEDKIKDNAPKILEALGGKENIISVDACITRLRVEVKDVNLVNKEMIKALGATAVVQVSNGIQAVFGVDSDKYKNKINELMKIPSNV